MRLFVALDIDPDIRDRITAFRNQMRSLAPDVRWVGPETFHVTLQFLGETKKFDEIRPTLKRVKAEAVQLSFRGVGFFPNPKSPRVFWIGIESDLRLQTLAESVAGVTRSLGFERDASHFTPHLTLARSGSGRPSAQAATFASARSPIAMRVSRVALPRCGSRTTFSRPRSSRGTSGSAGKTSRPAPARCPLRSALANAA